MNPKVAITGEKALTPIQREIQKNLHIIIACFHYLGSKTRDDQVIWDATLAICNIATALEIQLERLPEPRNQRQNNNNAGTN